MEIRRFTGVFFLLLASAIWGFSFVAQRVGMESMGPFAFNGIRFSLGGLVLLPLGLIPRKAPRTKDSISKRSFYFWGIATGLALFAGSSFQQMGIVYTQAGNAGFITGLYVILVPFLGIFLGQKNPLIFWVASLLAVFGLYLLCVAEGLSVNKGDLLVLLSAFAFAIHVLIIDHLTNLFDAVKVSIIQFLTCGLLSLVIAFCIETTTLAAVYKTAVPILYSGIMSVGVGYTLQTMGQKHLPAAPAAILLSAESVFALLGGMLILNETLDARGFLGCGLMLAGMILAQLPSLPKK